MTSKDASSLLGAVRKAIMADDSYQHASNERANETARHGTPITDAVPAPTKKAREYLALIEEVADSHGVPVELFKDALQDDDATEYAWSTDWATDVENALDKVAEYLESAYLHAETIKEAVGNAIEEGMLFPFSWPTYGDAREREAAERDHARMLAYLDVESIAYDWDLEGCHVLPSRFTLEGYPVSVPWSSGWAMQAV